MTHKIGEIIFAEGDVIINEGKPTVEIQVTNMGDRTIQVCSHYHFFEANNALSFDREKAFGLRLDIPAGSAVRFEPGEEKIVRLTTYAGERKLYGFQGWTQGAIDDPAVREAALDNMKRALKEG